MSEQLAGADLVLRRTELEAALARDVDGSVPPGWQSLKFVAVATGSVIESLIYVKRDGVDERENASDDSFDLLVELRKLMYRPGCGTWFTLTMHFDNQGHSATNYNFDEEADWSFPLDDESYIQDQKIFPRDREHIPPWLASKLGLGGASN